MLNKAQIIYNPLTKTLESYPANINVNKALIYDSKSVNVNR